MTMVATNAGEPVIEARGLVVRYGSLVAVDGLSLEVARGECLGLLGPNGAGKTTTVEVLEGLLRPSAGEVRLLGAQWGTGRDRDLRGRIGVALQETRLEDKLTVRETLRLFRSFYARGRDVADVFDIVGLAEKADARVGTLSGGQRQRLALACGLVGAPEVLFLDEPTTGLDPQARHRIWDVVREFLRQGGSALVTTHYMDEAALLCDRVAIIDHGRLLSHGAPATLVRTLGAMQLIEVLLAGGEPDLGALPGVRRVERRPGGKAALVVEDVPATLPELLRACAASGAAIVELATREATLDDVFVHLTGRGLRDG